jgi:hypothetical protein
MKRREFLKAIAATVPRALVPLSLGEIIENKTVRWSIHLYCESEAKLKDGIYEVKVVREFPVNV